MQDYSFLFFKKITQAIANTDFTGYTFQYPPLFLWKQAFLKSQALNAWKKNIGDDKLLKHLGIYIHIPFCPHKCTYCRYFSVELQEKSILRTYLKALANEMKIYGKILKKTSISTLYLGGGTPAMLSENQINSLFKLIHEEFDLSQCKQICFEGNPDFLDFRKLEILKRWNVKRLTIGVQSLDGKVINAVKRYQTQGAFLDCFRMARQLKIEHINIDIMAGLPKQTLNSFLATLKQVIDLRPDMIHVHPFYPTSFTLFSRKGLFLSEKNSRDRKQMSSLSAMLLEKAGYKPILFDANGLKQSSRNIQLSDAIEYNSPFLGLGAGAVSHVPYHLRYLNHKDISKYIKALNKKTIPVYSEIQLTKQDEMIAYIISALRYGEINKKKFKKLFNKDIEINFKSIIYNLAKRNKILNLSDKIVSQMRDIGDYSIFSKFFYSQGILSESRKKIGEFEKRGIIINKKELRKKNILL